MTEHASSVMARMEKATGRPAGSSVAMNRHARAILPEGASSSAARHPASCRWIKTYSAR